VELLGGISVAALGSQLLVGLSRAMILFIVCAGLSFVLGVLRVPNIAHGSLYMNCGPLNSSPRKPHNGAGVILSSLSERALDAAPLYLRLDAYLW
jgi:hypothetical protein